MQAKIPKLAVTGLCKRYVNGVQANSQVQLQVEPGTVHAIIGENGAGKSTLLKMLYGLEQPDAGELLLDGRVCSFPNPAAAIAAGIGMVPQHLQLVPSMTVAENIVLGDEPHNGPWLDRRRALDETRALAERFGMHLPPGARVADLSAGEQQRVEILKALRRGASLLLLDEPSALLAPLEAQALFDSIKVLVQASLTVILITHKMAEVRLVADSFTVMRAGRVVGSGRSGDFSEQKMAELIVGAPVTSAPRRRQKSAASVLQVRNLSLLRASGRPELDQLSFDVGRGEILGIAGVEGNGQTRLCEVLLGLRRPSSGTATLEGNSLVGGGVRHCRQLGVAYVPEDRLFNGVAPGMSIADNAAALDYFSPSLSRRGLLWPSLLAARAWQHIRTYAVKAPGPDTSMRQLSGGNMQKLVLARELATQPRLLVVSQPTRGVDIGAAQTLRQAILRLRDQGAAILLITADLEELDELSDRIAVLFEGSLVSHFEADQVDLQTLGRYMVGMSGEHGTSACLGARWTTAAPGARAGAWP